MNLGGRIALVAGASRGVGRGVALGLGEAGAVVYVAGRTRAPEEASEGLPGTIEETARMIDDLGGRGLAVQCDFRDDAAVHSLFDRVSAEQGGLDLLVNCVWGGYEGMVEADGRYTWEAPFWEQPMWRWDAMFEAGLRAAYSAGRLAARLMTARRSGLIVNMSYWAARKYMGNTAYGVSKAATDRLTSDMASEIRPYGVAVVSLYPGLVRTERVMRAVEFGAPLDLDQSESPQFIGRAVAALAADPRIMERTGRFLVAAELAVEYDFTDVDGNRPRALSLESA
ncbi:MAG: SDR family NAD(P)-dependent oxidoreductase [Proteobacteria bacterium]|nr:SDR family NAD(P)-dependent oxidoreductase [Pseudomonadota bacterium]